MINKFDIPYQCARVVMDTTAPDITFDSDGQCSYCSDFLRRSSHIIHEDPEQKKYGESC